MPHPGDHGGLGPAFDGDALGTGHGAAANGRGMSSHGPGEFQGQCRVQLMERQERHDGRLKVLDVFGLLALAASRVSLATACIRSAGAFCGQFALNLLDGRAWGPDASRKNPPADFLLDEPMLPGGLDAASEAGVTGRQDFPASRHREHLAGVRPDGVGGRAREEGLGRHANTVIGTQGKPARWPLGSRPFYNAGAFSLIRNVPMTKHRRSSKRRKRPAADLEATYICESCGEEIVVPVDISGGTQQDYVEDCPVCCHPMSLHVEIDDEGEARVAGEHE